MTIDVMSQGRQKREQTLVPMIAQQVSPVPHSASVWQRRPNVQLVSATHIALPPVPVKLPQQASALAQSSGPSQDSVAPMQSPGAVQVEETIMPPVLGVTQQISPEPQVDAPQEMPVVGPPASTSVVLPASVPVLGPESVPMLGPESVPVLGPESVCDPSARGPESARLPPESSASSVVELPQPRRSSPARMSAPTQPRAIPRR